MAAYRWDIHEQPLAIEIDLELIDRLSAEVMRGYGLVPKRGAEVGGLLLGTMAGDDGARTVQIQEFVPVPIEYRRGPSYLLSDTDRQHFNTAAAGRSGQVVGLYRSQTRDGLSVTDEDAALLLQHAPRDQGVFLLIKPSATRVPEAGFLVQVNGRMAQRTPEQLFSLRRKFLEGVQPTGSPPVEAGAPEKPANAARSGNGLSPPENRTASIPARTRVAATEIVVSTVSGASNTAPVPLTIEAQQFFAQELQRELSLQQSTALIPRGDAWQQARTASMTVLDTSYRKQRLRRLLLRAATAAVCLGLGCMAIVELLRPTPVPVPAKPVYYQFGLQALKDPKGVVVTWDGKAPAVEGAPGAMLLIQDDGQEVRVPLTPTELRRGGVLYHNRSTDLRFQLEVPQGQHSALIESVALAISQPPALKPVQAP